MAYKSLRDFMSRLEGEGRLARVSEPVTPVLELTEIDPCHEGEVQGDGGLVDAVAETRHDMAFHRDARSVQRSLGQGQGLNGQHLVERAMGQQYGRPRADFRRQQVFANQHP